MEKKIFKKVLAILTIVMIMATDFFVLGSNLISYAATLDSSTNNENIEFSAYFKNESGTRVDSISKSIKKDNLKMYAEVKVKNEGYFNGTIELQNSNFKIKNNILSTDIESIEGNKVNLKQINAGSTVEIELDIEPTISETIQQNMLSMDSTVKLTGTYIETTYKGLNIEATKTIKASFEVDESAQAELVTDIITNTVLSINGTNKRVVQLLIQSRLSENQYPVKQTILGVEIPQLSEKDPEEVKVLSLGTKATNGMADYSIEEYQNENGQLQITLKNDPDGDNNIKWNKNVYDEIVVTLIYSEEVDASKVEIKTTSDMSLYNSASTYTAEATKGIENKTLNNTITAQVESNSVDIYKGQLYANTKSDEKKDIEYKTKTTLEVTTLELADKVIIHEGPDIFVTNSLTELAANTKFVSTEINKEKMLAILGENGTIQINDGETIHSITKDTEANETGNIVINYTTALSELDIITSQPEKAGILEFNHTKAITENAYTMEQLKTIKQLKLKNSVTGILGESNVVENSTEAGLELKETTTKAELTVNKENLSTMTSNNEVILGIELITNGTQYDLYKNPTITIQLPSSVESIKTNSISPLYTEGFELKPEYNPTNKTLNITLTGEQLTYPEQAKQIYLQINLDMTLSKLAPNKTDKIVMTYTNQNATQYDSGTTDKGIIEKEIGIVSPSGIIAVNNIENYNIEGISGISEDKQVANIDKNTAVGTDVNFKIALINNTKNVANNVKILGNFPTNGSFTRGTETITNNFTTTLKSAINAQNCTIYYSNNINATSDLNDTNNGWTQDLASIANPKSYLIEIASMNAEESFEATYTVTLPQTLDYDLLSYTGYQVIYTEGTDTSAQKVQSILVGITTGAGIKLETNISATVGNDTLKNGDTVKAGEVIRYTLTVKNNGTQTLQNVVLKGGVPEGTVYVEPEEDYVYTGLSYYVEKPEVTEASKTIRTLEPEQEYSFSYETRVKTDITKGTQISNKAVAIYESYTIESNESIAKLDEGKLRVTIKRNLDERVELVPGDTMEYLIFVENLSNEEIQNLKMQIQVENMKVDIIKDGNLNEIQTINEEKTELNIDKIAVGEISYVKVATKITTDNVGNVMAEANIIDSDSNVYRSNKDIQEVRKQSGKISMTSDKDSAYLKIGDAVTYKITVENTGTSTSSFCIMDQIPQELEIQSIEVNGKIESQILDANSEETYVVTINNSLNYYFGLKAGEIYELVINAKVRYTEEEFETKTISNYAELYLGTDIIATTSEITNIIKGNKEDSSNGNMISGIAWVDQNQNGQKDIDEKLLPEIKVRLFDTKTNSIAKDIDGNNLEVTTNDKGEYIFSKIKAGTYIVLFEFDTTEYELTDYMKAGVPESQNSNVVLKAITIDGQEKNYAVTDTIILNESVANINIGLKEKLTFDLELNKYISRISIQNQSGTKTKEYNDSVFQKVEINRKQLNNSLVVIEYTIRVKNAGEIAGNVNNIVDYLPNGLEFSSELNPDWYISGQNLHTKALANDKLQPGETREVKLILTKKMTENNTGLINNRAEIEESYNELGKVDIDSTPNNLMKGEDDLGSADVIISISTGIKTIGYTILIIINTALIAFAIYLVFKKNRGKI